MFTGIVEGIGVVQEVESLGTHTQVWIKSPFSLQDVRLGDSIAVNGCCLTVTSLKGKVFSADISPETLARSNLGDLSPRTSVNLERPLRLGDRLGGHLVQGHVDGVGKILSKRFFPAQPNPYYAVRIQVPPNLIPYMVEKGSVTVDGISLTINEVDGKAISLCIIPHTQERTTLTAKGAGDRVNLEADLVLKFIEKMMKPRLTAALKTLQPSPRRRAKRRSPPVRAKP